MVNKGRINPPDETWGNISNKLDIEDAWGNIDKNLDINTVWNRVDHQLTEDHKMKTYEKISYVPIILLLLLLSWSGLQNELYLDDSHNDKVIVEKTTTTVKPETQNRQILQKEKQAAKEFDKKPNKNIEQREDKSNKIIEKTDRSEIKNDLSVPDQKRNNNNSKAELKNPNVIYADQNAALSIAFNQINSLSGGLDVNFNIIDRRAPELINIVKDTSRENSCQNHWYYGIGVSANRTWLNDNRLKRASEGSQLFNAIATNNLSIKLNAGLEINQNWGIHTDFVFLGSIGQSYGEYINGKYLQGNVNVDYNGVQLALKRTLPSLFNQGNSLSKNLLIGGYLSHIYKVTQNEKVFISNDREQRLISNLYKSYDVGIWGGIEMFYNLNDAYQLGTIIQYKQGLNNIYKGTDQIPAYLRKTNTSELSISVVIRRYSK